MKVMKKMKRMKGLWIGLISLSVVVGIFVWIIHLFIGNLLWSTWEYKVRDFDTYQSDFQTVADLAYREYNKGQMKNSYIIVKENPDGTVNLIYEIVNTEEFVEVTMSQEEKQSLEKIVAKSFRRTEMAYLYLIRVYKNQVEFEIESRRYSLIYRTDGHKPEFLNSHAKGDFKLKKISDHWYHAMPVID